MAFLEDRPWLRRALKIVCWTAVVLVLFVGGLLLFLFRHAIYHRYLVFPQQAEAMAALRAQRGPVPLDDGWNEFRGICHTHSHISHDSEIAWEDVLAAAKIADVNFLCMTDHPPEGKADFSIQWRGLHDGVLFIPGFEFSQGLLVWGLPDATVIDAKQPIEKVAYDVWQGGGLVYFAHSEYERPWDMRELNGMEIYNIHTDFKDESYAALLPDMFLNDDHYGDQVLRLLFDRQTPILDRWDQMNLTRKVVGIAANDAHQNIGVHAIYNWQDDIEIRKNEGETIATITPGPLTRPLWSLFFGPLEANRELFRISKDPYERSLRFVNTHVLAEELTQPAILEALREGRVYIAFDMLCDARGFVFFAESGETKAVMGQTMPMASAPVFRAAWPLPGRAILKRNGIEVAQAEGSQIEYRADRPGKYRIEVEVQLQGEWLPWIYSNPVEITP